MHGFWTPYTAIMHLTTQSEKGQCFSPCFPILKLCYHINNFPSYMDTSVWTILTFLPAPTFAFFVPLTFFCLFFLSFLCFRPVFLISTKPCYQKKYKLICYFVLFTTQHLNGSLLILNIKIHIHVHVK